MNILMIDDEPRRWLLIRRVLEANDVDISNVNVYSAHGFEQVQYYLQDSRIDFDLILLDHDMPLMNGYDVAHQFLIQRDIDVIIISNNEPASNRMLGLLGDYDVWAERLCIVNPEPIAALIFQRLQDLLPVENNSMQEISFDGMT